MLPLMKQQMILLEEPFTASRTNMGLKCTCTIRVSLIVLVQSVFCTKRLRAMSTDMCFRFGRRWSIMINIVASSRMMVVIIISVIALLVVVVMVVVIVEIKGGVNAIE